MSLDPHLQALVAKAAKLPAMRSVPVNVIRSGDVRRLSTGLPPAVVRSATDHHIPGPRGQLRIRVYLPETQPCTDALLPVTVFFHGSGFVICSIESHDEMCRHLCRGSGSIVVSVDYALAPEHPFPAAPDDCLAAVRWVAAHAAQFGGDATRLALAGDSAGANLATVTAQRLRDEGATPVVRAQLLLYPVTDHYSAHHPSYVERADCGLSGDDMAWFWDHYLPDPALADHPWVSPLRAPDLAGLPPALVITADHDVLRDEGEAYADRLREAGVPTSERRYADVNHGFMNWVGLVPSADEAMALSCDWLREQLA